MLDDLKQTFHGVLVIALALALGAYIAIFNNGGTSLQAEEQPGDDAEVLVSHGLWQQRLGSNPAPSGNAIGVKSKPCAIPRVG